MERAGRANYTFACIMTETVNPFERPLGAATQKTTLIKQLDISVKNLDSYRQIGTKNLASLQPNNVPCMKTAATIHKGFCDFAKSFGISAVTKPNKVETRLLAFSSA